MSGLIFELHVFGRAETLWLGCQVGCRVIELLSILRGLTSHAREQRLVRCGWVDDHDVCLLEVLDERVQVIEVQSAAHVVATLGMYEFYILEPEHVGK